MINIYKYYPKVTTQFDMWPDNWGVVWTLGALRRQALVYFSSLFQVLLMINYGVNYVTEIIFFKFYFKNIYTYQIIKKINLHVQIRLLSCAHVDDNRTICEFEYDMFCIYMIYTRLLVLPCRVLSIESKNIEGPT